MLVVLVLLLGAAAVCARLGVWQLDRAEVRGEAAARERVAQEQDVRPVALEDVLAPSTALTGDTVGRLVEVEGEYEAGELLVPGRVVDERSGYLVLTPFVVDTDDGPARLAVVRGWVATPADAAAAPAPSGVVTVTGYLRSGESAGAGGLPEGQVAAVSPAELVNRWGGPMYAGYLTVAPGTSTDETAPGALVPLPRPEPDGSLNVQNLAYALQWWIFGGFALLLWVRMVRDTAREDVEDDDAQDDQEVGVAQDGDDAQADGDVQGAEGAAVGSPPSVPRGA